MIQLSTQPELQEPGVQTCLTKSTTTSASSDQVHNDQDKPSRGEKESDANLKPNLDEKSYSGLSVEEFREYEYPQLKDCVYLDHGGTTLYAKSLIENFSMDMTSNLYGNPHSTSTPSELAGHRIDIIRERALRFFDANPNDWDLVFVSNATAAIKLVMECFRDNAVETKTPFWYGYHKDAHTSLVGGRQLTKTHRCFHNDAEVDTWIYKGCRNTRWKQSVGLLSYPGQSNMTGRRLPTRWPTQVRKATCKHKIYTLLDAAALASTAPLNLSKPSESPDFVALSFYKIFGFPNIGALLVQKQSQNVLRHRKYFGGGTVEMVISIGHQWHALKDGPIHDSLEDGTLPFHSIFALDHAITVHERLYGPNPMNQISNHTSQLAKLLYQELKTLTHYNGNPVVKIYNENDTNPQYGTPTIQGSTIALNILNANGSIIGYADVESAANSRKIYIRSGSLCNPGGMASYLDWSPKQMKAAYKAGHRCNNPTQIVFGKPTGVVRVSLGAMNTKADVYAFIGFVREVYVDVDGDGEQQVGGRLTGIDSNQNEMESSVMLVHDTYVGAGHAKSLSSFGWACKMALGTTFTRRHSKGSVH